MNTEVLWDKFGPEGLVLAAVLWLVSILFNLWIAMRTNAHLHALKLASERDSIRFSKLHEERAEIIKTMYNMVQGCSEAGIKYVTEDTKENKMQFFRSMMEFGRYFKEHRIYFGDAVCDKIQEVSSTLFTAVGERYAYEETERIKNMPEWEKGIRIYNCLVLTSPSILWELEREFKMLLGVEVDFKRKPPKLGFMNPETIREIRKQTGVDDKKDK